MKRYPGKISMDCPVKAFALRDGGEYLNRLGERVVVKLVSPVGGEPSNPFKFERVNGQPELYMADGRYNDSYGEPANDLDLVSEIHVEKQ
jgi:hypothetical protein